MSASGRDENLFRLLVESAVDYAIFILDPKGHVATWNPGAERIKGYRADEIIGKHFSIFYPPADVAAGKCEHELVVAAAEGRFEDEGLRLRKDGSTFYANVIITALRDSAGTLLGFAKVTRDLTESAARVEAERSLANLSRLQELAVALAGAVTEEQVIDIVLERGSATLGAAAAGFLRPRGEVLELVATTASVSPEIAARYARIRITQRVPGVIAATTGVAEWTTSGALFAERYPDALGTGLVVGAACSLPLKVGTRVIGAVSFRFTEPRTFPPTDRALIETFAEQAAQALVRAEAHRQLNALRELAQAFSGATTTAEVTRIIVEHARRVNGGDTCTLHRHDESVPALVLLDESGVDPELLPHVQFLTHESASPSWRALDAQEGLWVETAEEYARLFPSINRIASKTPRVRAFWALPLVSEGRAVALLAVGFREERIFTPGERQFVDTFTRHCSDALLRANRLEDERQARGWLATTLRSIGDAVIATDRHGRVTMMNPIAEQLTGWSESEARTRPLSEVFVIVNEQTREPVVSPVEKVLELGTIVGLANHTILIARDGTTTPIDDSGAPIRGPDGAIAGVVLVFRDVTEKKREEGRRRLLEQAGAALAESLDYEVTLKKVAQLAVPGFAEWCGVDIVEEGPSDRRQVAVAHEDPAKVAWAIELGKKYPPAQDAPTGVPNVLRTGKPEIYPEVSDDMLRAGAQDEEHLRIMLGLKLRSVIIVPLRAHGRTLGALSFIRSDGAPRFNDVDLVFAEEIAARCANAIDNARSYDAEQQARSAADEANRAKDEFLAMVSHELRTPLNAIMGWAKMLSTGSLDAEKSTRAVATIDRNAVAMAQLIEDLLDISRIISGKMRLEIQTTSVDRIVEAAIDAVQPAADAKEIVITTRSDVDAQLVLGDPARLQQIVWNLLSNAVKFTPAKGTIDVEIVRDRGGIEISVIDSGRGIDPRFLPYVFDAFRQEDASHTRSRGGLGLGLAITRQLVELHGGSITATSAGEGRGATFRVSLPSGAITTSSPQRTGRVRKFRLEGALERLPKLEGVHVLVVDDEEDARYLLKTILDELGAKVTVAESAAEALAAIERDIPTVLISDIGMPNRDGYDLIRAVRQLAPERGGNIPAAALTAYARAEDRRRAIDAGFSMHLSKPVDPTELVAVVASLTQR